MVQKLKSYRIFGFKITPVTKEDLFGIIKNSIETRSKVIIASQNLHGVYMSLKDPKVQNLQDKSIVHIDGMPIVWLAKMAGLRVTSKHRTDWISWFLPLLEMAEKQSWRVFYLGCDSSTLSKGLAVIKEKYPALKIESHDGFFDADPESLENTKVISRINEFETNLLIVGMGMGRQEHWISDNLDRLNVHCIGTAGACIEYFAGVAPIAPRWMGNFGLEWAFRLFNNPRRFWVRYLIEPWLTVGLIMKTQMNIGARKRT